MEERKRGIRLLLQGRPVSRIARVLQRSRDWLYRWKTSYESGESL